MAGFDFKAIAEGLLGGLVKPITDTIQKGMEGKQKSEEIAANIVAQVNDTISKSDLAQIEVNKAEAMDSSLFVKGWRPFLGWSTGIGWVIAQIIVPIIDHYIMAIWPEITIPKFDSTVIDNLLYGILGLAGIRGVQMTAEVVKKK